MKILTRYLLRVHMAPFVFALFALTSLLFVNTIARRFPEMAGKGLPASVILQVCWLSLPHIIALTLPMAVLVAVLYAFSQLAADNEITALKASGVNLLKLLVPLLGASLVLGAFMLYFNDRILPETNHSLKLLLMDISRKTPTLERQQLLPAGVENRSSDQQAVRRRHLRSQQRRPGSYRLRRQWPDGF